jgi:hypothetical protein
VGCRQRASFIGVSSSDAAYKQLGIFTLSCCGDTRLLRVPGRPTFLRRVLATKDVELVLPQDPVQTLPQFLSARASISTDAITLSALNFQRAIRTAVASRRVERDPGVGGVLQLDEDAPDM